MQQGDDGGGVHIEKHMGEADQPVVARRWQPLASGGKQVKAELQNQQGVIEPG